MILKKISTLLKKILIKSIVFYQKYISLDSGLLKKYGFTKGFVCMHYPTCSEYTKQAIDVYGITKGLWYGLKRIYRCRPGQNPTVDILK